MKTQIEAQTVTKGTWVKIIIVSVTHGFSQILKDGKWENTTATPQRHEDEILTLGKFFEDHVTAEKFMSTKSFKSLLKNLKTNWK